MRLNVKFFANGMAPGTELVIYPEELMVLNSLLKEVGKLRNVPCGAMSIYARKQKGQRTTNWQPVVGYDWSVNMDGEYGDAGRGQRMENREIYCNKVVREALAESAILTESSEGMELNLEEIGLPGTWFYHTDERIMASLQVDRGEFLIAAKVYGGDQSLWGERTMILVVLYALAYFAGRDMCIEAAFDDLTGVIMREDLKAVGALCDELFSERRANSAIVHWREWLMANYGQGENREFFVF